MHYFQYQDGELFAEDVPVREIARKVGTPLYLYSTRTLSRHYHAFNNALSEVRHMVCYSVKVNSNISILRLFRDLGSGFDIVSGGELYRVLRAGSDPRTVVYSGVGKGKEEIEYALRQGILMFNVESEEELCLIDRAADMMSVKASIAIRINPDLDPVTHPYLSTGHGKSKFGVLWSEAEDIYKMASGLRNINIIGMDCHIGSQITDLRPFTDTLTRLKELYERLKVLGMDIKYLDLGGGLGIRYREEEPPPPEVYAKTIIKGLEGLDLTLIMEPGRVLTGNAGVLITRILYFKSHQSKNFFIVDAGMNDLIRPSLYGSYQEIMPVISPMNNEERVEADVVGPICESGDFLAKERRLPPLGQGDLIAIIGAGAYGFVMSSNYNSRPRIPEVMVQGREFEVIREREQYPDLIRGERIASFIK